LLNSFAFSKLFETHRKKNKHGIRYDLKKAGR